MSQLSRPVAYVVTPEPVVEGAGVHLRRSIGTRRLDHLDPFLLLDHFESVKPADYEAGFPYHPHRGIETVTLVRKGEVKHSDSLGHKGSIGAGDIQWMTSGSGILHEEMPQVRPEGIAGLQLWLNLPPGATFREEVPRGHTAFAYVDNGEVRFGPAHKAAHAPSLVVFGEGDIVEATAGAGGGRFLLAAARPLNEPIARYGPFVMNTRAEIEQTLEDLRSGRFARAEPRDEQGLA